MLDKRLIDLIIEFKTLALECAGELESHVNMRHGDPSPSEHPVTTQKRIKDMQSVVAVRRLAEDEAWKEFMDVPMNKQT